jgi:hypothetical protein
MKNIVYLFSAFAIISFSSCSKSGTSPTKQTGTTTATAMYPASYSLSQGGSTVTFQFSYDGNNNITKYTNGGSNETDVDLHTVVRTVSSGTDVFITTYAYAGASNAPVDIYTTIPTTLSISLYHKDLQSGGSTTSPNGAWLFTGGGNTLTQEATSDQGGKNLNFAYDANGNLKTVSFVSLSGAQAGIPYSILTVTSLDNKPSPFSAVKGYNIISYPQAYLAEYALAFCKNNPTQMVLSQYDVSTKTYIPVEQDDFTYLYNDKGYPTSITVNISYPGPPETHFTETYTYTYK